MDLGEVVGGVPDSPGAVVGGCEDLDGRLGLDAYLGAGGRLACGLQPLVALYNVGKVAVWVAAGADVGDGGAAACEVFAWAQLWLLSWGCVVVVVALVVVVVVVVVVIILVTVPVPSSSSSVSSIMSIHVYNLGL